MALGSMAASCQYPGCMAEATADDYCHGCRRVVCDRHPDAPWGQHEGQDTTWDDPAVRQCAGAAAYRANVAQYPRDSRLAIGPRRRDVFSTPGQFLEHHGGR